MATQKNFLALKILILIVFAAGGGSNLSAGDFQVNPRVYIHAKWQEPLYCRLGHMHRLDCWLSVHPEIGNYLFWRMHLNDYPSVWKDWDAPHKAQLRKSYDDYVQWYEGGMGAFSGAEFPDPIPNGIQLQDDQGALLNMDENTGWAVYRSYAAFILAAEVEGWFPWSILDLEDRDMKDLFLSTTPHRFNVSNPNPNQPPGTGYFTQEIVPAPPTVVMRFLKDNHIIRATPLETVGALLNWMKNLNHMMGDYGKVIEYFYHWGYRGPPPLSFIFTGTHLTDPEYINNQSITELRNWIHACFGSTYFLEWVLRIGHIPVREMTVCGHYVPYFPTLNKYLSHGDDPYNAYNKSTPDFPGTDRLVNAATFHAWFGSDPTQDWHSHPEYCNNIGRQPLELALQRLPDYLVYLYCQDTHEGKSHGDGQVMSSFKNIRTLEELETFHLWDKLDDKVQAGGGCTAFPFPF